MLGAEQIEKQVQGYWVMIKFLKFASTISSFSTPILFFAGMGEASMEALAKKKGRRGSVHRDAWEERVFFYVYNNG